MNEEKPYLYTNTEWEDLLDYNHKTWISINRFKRLKQQNEFLAKRENKLQTIEQMYKSGSVDLDKLRKIVLEEE